MTFFLPFIRFVLHILTMLAVMVLDLQNTFFFSFSVFIFQIHLNFNSFIANYNYRQCASESNY